LLLVAGLGNPGDEYARTLHNLGFLVIDRLADKYSIRVTRPDSKALVGEGEIEGKPVMLAKPQTFMNLSGIAVQRLMAKHDIALADLLLVYDELDLPWPRLRIKPKGSAAGHNGVKSVIEQLGTKEFPRVRLGVHPGHPIRDGREYLLAPFQRSHEKELDELISLGADAVRSIIADGVEKSMTIFNRRP
jgi:peptidyl-tRNA hydrolase, PTH1 family